MIIRISLCFSMLLLWPIFSQTYSVSVGGVIFALFLKQIMGSYSLVLTEGNPETFIYN